MDLQFPVSQRVDRSGIVGVAHMRATFAGYSERLHAVRLLGSERAERERAGRHCPYYGRGRGQFSTVSERVFDAVLA